MTHAPARPGLARPAVAVLCLVAAGCAAMVVSGCSCRGPEHRRLVSPEGVPLVRVKLGEDVPSLAVSCSGPYRVTAGRKRVASGSHLGWTPVQADGGAIRVGRHRVRGDAAEIEPERGGTFKVRQRVDGVERERTYRGTLRVVRTPSGRLRAVNIVDTEAYVAGVMVNEMPGSWHLEALKAQAVAARTYALFERIRRRGAGFDVFDSSQSQVYGGADSETAKAWKAVAATRGIVGTDPEAGRAQLLKMYYHSTCGGATSPSAVAFGGRTPGPLRGVACTYCRASGKYRWTGVEIRKRDIGAALRRHGGPAVAGLGRVTGVEVVERGPRGRAAFIRVIDVRGKAFRVQANEWRLWVGPRKLPSTRLAIRDAGDRIIVDGYGWGHGVGMCQWGAEHLARRGMTGEQILRFYYPGIRLARAY